MTSPGAVTVLDVEVEVDTAEGKDQPSASVCVNALFGCMFCVVLVLTFISFTFF